MPLPQNQIHPTMQEAAVPMFPNGSVHAGKYTLIFRVRERQTQTLLKEHRLLIMPQRFSQTTEIRSSLYYTQGGPVADTLAGNGVGMTYFTISGHTGFGGIRGSSPAAMPTPGALITPQGLVDLAQTLVTTIPAGVAFPG